MRKTHPCFLAKRHFLFCNVPIRWYVLATLVTLFFGQAAFSQTRLGISGGATSANFDYPKDIQNPEHDNENKVGLNGGIKLDIPLGKKGIFRLTPEIFINQNGTKDEYYTSYGAFADSLSQNKVSLDYIGIYFPFKINLQSKNGTGVYFLGSLYADYTIGAQVASNVDVAKPVEFNSSKDRIDYGYRLSIGLLFSESVGIELGYSKGLKNIEFSTKLENTNTNYIVNNKGLTVSLLALF